MVMKAKAQRTILKMQQNLNITIHLEAEQVKSI